VEAALVVVVAVVELYILVNFLLRLENNIL
jgi:hypothetical protein